jgi:uncharacterized protein (TIGR00251 family)
MSPRRFHLHDGKRGAALAVRVTPKASRNEITGITDDGTVKVRLTAAPIEGQANAKLIDFLSEVLGVPPSRVEIVAGQNGRDKLISVIDMEKEEVHKLLLAYTG